MSNHTQAKEKLNTGQYTALNRYILNIIRCAERTKPSIEWEWTTDQSDIVSFLKIIKKNGSITIDEI
jgi:hypothetical protein